MSTFLSALFIWSFIFQIVAMMFKSIPEIRTLVLATCFGVILFCCWNMGSPIAQTSIGISFSLMAVMSDWSVRPGVVPARVQLLALGLSMVAYGVVQ